MPRRPSFRRDTDLQKEIRRLNKLVQNKQSRLRVDKGLEVTDVSTTKYKEFNSRKQIDRYRKEMESFLQRSSDFTVANSKGAKLSYSDVRDVEKEIKRINKQRENQWNQYKDLPYNHRGISTGHTVEERADPKFGMGDIKFADFKPKKFNVHRFESQRQFEQYRQELLETFQGNFTQKFNELYKQNYLKAVHDNLGWEGRNIFTHVSNMPLDEFIKYYYTENNAHIGFIYDKVAVAAKVAEIEKAWGINQQ